MLSAWDYTVIGFTMAISLSIGLFFRFSGGRQKSTKEYLMAGRDMSRFPVILSLVVTRLSAVALLGEPADIYQYGTQRVLAQIVTIFGIFVAAYVFLPVYFAVRTPTIFGYLDRRFGKAARLAVSILNFIQTALYMSVVLYAPSLALSAVTDLTTETSILVMGIVCTIYSSLGGLKAVLWTDVFQAFLMYCCLLVIMVKGIAEIGFSDVFRIANNGDKIEFFNFSFDWNVRYTFWNSIAQGLAVGIGGHAVNQVEVQRMLTIKDLKNAQSALMWSIIPTVLMQAMTLYVGLLMYAVFADCDPVADISLPEIFKADQIVPYYLVSRLSSIPGVTGLCVAGIFSGSLSSLSSAVNSLSAIAMEDFIGPFACSKDFKQLQSTFLAKMLVLFNGFLFIALAFLASLFPGILQAGIVVNGMTLGPILGLFTLGILTQTANQKGVLVGLTSGVLLAGWIGFGSSFSGIKKSPLTLSTAGCLLPQNGSFNTSMSPYLTSTVTDHILFNNNFTNVLSGCRNDTPGLLVSKVGSFDPDPVFVASKSPFVLYQISFMWVGSIGFVCSIVVGYITSFLIDWGKTSRKQDPVLLSPVIRNWITKPKVTTVTPEELEVFC